MTKLIVTLALIALALTARIEHFEDGSGIVTIFNTSIGYCVPATLCTK